MSESELPGVATSSPRRSPLKRGSHALAWWTRLNDPTNGDPATLARLRRARSTLEALAVRAAVELARRLGAASGEASDWRTRGALDLARVLAHVREHDAAQPAMRAAGWKKFAGERRETEAGEDRPLLSEARFRRLLETGDGEEKVAAFTRLIALMGSTVKIDALAEDFMLWSHPELGDKIREQWAFQYYAAGTAAPAVPVTDTEDAAE